MKTPFFALPRHALLHAISTLCVGLGCASPLCLAMHLPSPYALCLTTCAATALAQLVLDCLPRLRGLLCGLMIAAVAALLWPYRSHAQPLGAAITLFVNGYPLALGAYARFIVVALSVLMTLIGASLSRNESAFFPLALLTIALLIVISFLGIDVGALPFVPLTLALLLAARVPGAGTLRIVPGAALVLALSLLLLPLGRAPSPALSQIARDTRQKIDDYLFFTDPRTAFSLNAVGWQPMGSDRLGGPVNPTNDPVMEVTTPSRALLRGTVKNEYTGLGWIDSTDGRRYLLVSPRFRTLRKNLFDTQRPKKNVLDTLPAMETLTVSMRADAASTLYLTQRFSSPRGEDIVPYFSPASEVFATRSLETGNHYTFQGRLLTASTQGVRSAVLEAYDTNDPNLEAVRQAYLQLPASVEPRVYQLAQQLTQSEKNDFDKAAALCAYLQSSFPYTMNQRVPPLTRDFVSWFLFDEQQGYCTSFASSLCVLARCAGLPARYIEGYAAIPDSDGIARVTQQYAHAWSEIYFPGFGWLTFDPTPGSGSGYDGTGGGAPDAPSDDSQTPDDPNATDSGNDNDPAQNALRSPSPSPTPSPTPTSVPTPSPSPTPQHDDPRVTPTPEITPAPTPQPTSTPSPTPPVPNRQRDDHDTPMRLFALLAILLLTVLVALRLYLCAPARVAARYRNPGDRLLIWYRSIEEALLCMGVVAQPGEAPASFLMRAQQALPTKVSFAPLGKALCVARYSRHRLKAVHADKAQQTYGRVFAMMTPAQTLRFFARRIRYGIKLQ